MGARLLVVLISLALTSSLFAKEVFLSVTGKANGFFSDVRIFNPSFTKDITVNAQYLPAGNANNTGAAVVPLVIPKRSMKIYDDAVASIFNRTGAVELGAIRLTSDDDFAASQRVFQDARASHQKGTLGQFVAGQDVSRGIRKGVILQLKSGNATLGSFRTNWGGVNPNTTVANVTLRLFDSNNAQAGTVTIAMQPYAVISPSNIINSFGNPSNDLTDAWISFESDHPLFLYGSVVDNGAVDQTFVAVEDSGVAPPVVEPQTKTVNVQAIDWDFSLTPSAPLAAGDQVKFIVKGVAGNNHGFRLFTPDGNILIDIDSFGAAAVERTVTLPKSGEYVYVCTRTACGAGHTDMNGSFTIP